MDPGADLSPPGIARTIADFLEAFDLERVRIVGNDSGGATSQVLAANHPDRLARLVLTNCDTHENFPPGLFKALPPLAALPGAAKLLAAPFRINALARAAFAPFARTRIPAELVSSWVSASRDPGVMRDLQKFARGMDKRHTLAAAEKLRGGELPILLAWAPGDRFFPISYAERLAGEAGEARIIRIENAKTFVPLDQPAAVAEAIAEFADSAA
jgi:pimeloyl-ACP methyl ester carboxylesterase